MAYGIIFENIGELCFKICGRFINEILVQIVCFNEKFNLKEKKHSQLTFLISWTVYRVPKNKKSTKQTSVNLRLT